MGRQKKLSAYRINRIYHKYKIGLFTKLIEINSNISSKDKGIITQLLNKPWNPYIFRHSALTDKSKVLKEHVLRQHAGWSERSQMHLKYLRYFGNESSESILEAYGILTTNKETINKSKPKQCPNCSELMKRLGYTKFVAAGGDWGGVITDLMGAQAPPELIGIHTNFPGIFPPEIDKAIRIGVPLPSTLSTEEKVAVDRLADT